MDHFITNQLLLREVFNASWAVGAIGIVIIVLLYLREEVQTPGWYTNKANKLAIGLLVFFTGEAIYRGTISVLLYRARLDWPVTAPIFLTLMVGFAIGILGLLCMVRLLSRPPGNWSWFLIYLLMALATITTWSFG